ncbi:MAG TPA: penicillin-binding protein, partial [Candidatus Ligilactobacillus excrementipullorum]|nr:penicillin-binding protein [Candidatus Ligilactobacillus excrementipullorum]
MSKQDSNYSRVQQRKQQQQNKRPAHPRKKRHLFAKIFWSLFLLAVVAIAAAATLFFSYARTAPALNEENLKNPGATVLYDSANKKILDLGSQNAVALKPNEVPQQLKDAVTSIEDRRFYQHQGVDIKRTFGAAFANLTHSSNGLQGGSTLDQQLIKLAFFSTKKSDQTLKRKAQEAWLARKLDQTYSKNQILTFYVNKVFMGYSSYGMQTAAKFYYGKSVKDLDLAQTALIAGIPNAPSQYNPYFNSQLALARRNEVLDAMYKNKKISQADLTAAKAEKIDQGLLPVHQNEQKNNKAKISDPYIKQVITEVKKKGYDPYGSQLKIYTNLDMNIQKRLYNIANSNDYVYFPDNKLQIASTIVNPNNGKVVAMLGGRKTGNVTYGLNRAVQTDRTNGSTAKPLMDYAPAIEY